MANKYYLPELTTNPITRLKYRVIDKRHPAPDVPMHAQIQTISGCNANCVFCPNKKTDIDIKMGNRMDWDLFRKIVDELLDWGVKRFSPYLMNEPMLDPEFPERVRYISDRKGPGQFTKINSHGGLLTEDMGKRILDSGLDRVNFSVQGLDPDIYFDVMKLPLQKTLDNIERFMELKRDGNYKKPRVRVCMLVTDYIEPQVPEILKFWGDRGVKVNFNQLENRGHHEAIKSESILASSHELKTFDWCTRLLDQIYILWDGRLVQCCADWEQSGIMGNTAQDSLREIWNGERYKKFRMNFMTGDVKGTLCDGCTKDDVDDMDEEADWDV